MQTDYICREDAINFFENMTWYHVNRRGQLVDGANSDTGLYKAKDVYKGLHDIPAAAVAPVVICKDCIHNNDCDIQYSAQAGETFFCGFGETEKDVREDVYE